MDSLLKDWGTLGPAAIDSGLADLNLSFDRDNRAVICTRCKYALQPSGQTVSKHLWERYAVNAKRRRGLHALINSVKLPIQTRFTRLQIEPDHTRIQQFTRALHAVAATSERQVQSLHNAMLQRCMAKTICLYFLTRGCEL